MLTNPTTSDVQRAIRQVIEAFRLNWRLFLSIHIIVNVLSILILTPLLSVLLGWLVLASGHTALTDEDILFFVLSPTGMLVLLTCGALYTTVVIFEQAAMISAAHGVTSGHAITISRLGRYMLVKFWPLFRLAAQMILRTALIMAPILTLSAGVYFSFLTEFDINYYINHRPPVFWWAGSLILICLLSMLALLLRVFSGWVLALPMLLVNDEKPHRVLQLSRRASVSMRFRISITLLILFFANAGLLGLVSVLAETAVNGSVNLAGDSLEVLAYLLGGVMLVWLVVNVAVTFLSNSILSLVIIYIFVRLTPVARDWKPDVVVAAPGSSGLWGLSATKLASLAIILSLMAGLAVSIAINQMDIEDHTMVIAHRGASADAPENTLAAMEQAIKDGADWVEIDVQETRDGDVVVIHDSDLKKIGGSGLKVFDASLAELQSVDIGSWKHPSFSDQRIPTLQQLLELCKNRIKVLIELKYYGQEKQLEQRVAEIVEATGMQDQIKVMSLNYPGIQKMKSIQPQWSVGLLASVSLGDITRLEADFFAVNASFASRALVRRTHSQGKSVLVWTINDPVSMSAMMSKGVDGIITDKPQLANNIRLERAELSVHQRIMIQLASFIGRQTQRPEQ
jgi:glycerophosphoryl diester phosphodiesterase